MIKQHHQWVDWSSLCWFCHVITRRAQSWFFWSRSFPRSGTKSRPFFSRTNYSDWEVVSVSWLPSLFFSQKTRPLSLGLEGQGWAKKNGCQQAPACWFPFESSIANYSIRYHLARAHFSAKQRVSASWFCCWWPPVLCFSLQLLFQIFQWADEFAHPWQSRCWTWNTMTSGCAAPCWWTWRCARSLAPWYGLQMADIVGSWRCWKNRGVLHFCLEEFVPRPTFWVSLDELVVEKNPSSPMKTARLSCSCGKKAPPIARFPKFPVTSCSLALSTDPPR